MIFRTPYLGRERGFLHFGFPDEDENVEMQDPIAQASIRRKNPGQAALGNSPYRLDKKKTAVTDLQTNHCNEYFFLSIPE
jgi:hypothetical protein